MTKLDLRSALDALNVKEPLRLAHRTPQFKIPDEMTPLPTTEAQSLRVEKNSVAAPHPLAAPHSLDTEQSVSKLDTVQNSQCPNLTVSKMDSVHSGPCEKMTTVSNVDSVQNGQGANLTVSKLDPVDRPVKKPSSGFTAVPHALLRGAARFSDPLDFMIYLHLYTYSYGFGRDTASMGQAQLEHFTGATKNTIKRSLERLTSQGWIQCVEEFEHSRTTRKWKVKAADDAPDPNLKNRGSKLDSVKNGQCPNLTQGGSKIDPVTGSKFHPYKERDPKQKSNHTLSALPSVLQQYFENLKPQRKRESEWRAFLELQDDYEAQDIADCLATLQERSRRDSSGGSSTFHSPMAYLAKAMSDVLVEVLLARKQSSERAEREQRQAEADRKFQAEQAHEAAEWAQRKLAFHKAFPDEERQLAVISELCTGLPWKPTSQAGKAFAIDHWWLRLMASERDLLLA